MSTLDRRLSGGIQPANVQTATVTNATATATQAAPPASQQILIVGIMISANAAPAAPVTANLQYGTGPTVLIPIQIPAAAFAVIVRSWQTHPIEIPAGQQVQLTVPALGSGVTCTVELETIVDSL